MNKWTGNSQKWDPIGPGFKASGIYAGGFGVFVRRKTESTLYQYPGKGEEWLNIGGAGGESYVVTDDSVFMLKAGKVLKYVSPNNWVDIGAPTVSSIVVST